MKSYRNDGIERRGEWFGAEGPSGVSPYAWRSPYRAAEWAMDECLAETWRHAFARGYRVIALTGDEVAELERPREAL